MITFKDVCYSVFDAKTGVQKQILSNLNLSFPKGKLTVVTGQNGSGKSTMLKLIMGLIQPFSGQIYFNGQNFENMDITQRAKAGITMAFQQPVKFKGLTVQDMLCIASGNQLSVADSCQFLGQVGLCAKDYLNRPLDGSLSGGEMKRIEIALALAKGGEVFLFDEPEAGIDLWSFDELVDIFKNLKGKTVIIVSHQKKVLQCADKILLLKKDAQPVMGDKSKMLKLLSLPRCAKLGGQING